MFNPLSHRLFSFIVAPSGNKLIDAIEQAKLHDIKDHEKQLKQYEKDYADWEKFKNFASKITAKDSSVYTKVIDEIDIFNKIKKFFSSIDYEFHNYNLVEINIRLNGEKMIPSEKKSVLKSGKLSIKSMPKTEFYKLYQDYVCSCVLRVAKDLFALLPMDMIIIHAIDDILNSQTDHKEEKVILSVGIPRQTLYELNFNDLNPSNSISNFIHRMNFKNTKGFSPVEKLEITTFENL